MNSGAASTQAGKGDARASEIAAWSGAGQIETMPRGVPAKSQARSSVPHSPPLARHCTAVSKRFGFIVAQGAVEKMPVGTALQDGYQMRGIDIVSITDACRPCQSTGYENGPGKL